MRKEKQISKVNSMTFYKPHVNTEAENLEILRKAEEDRLRLLNHSKSVKVMPNSRFGLVKKQTEKTKQLEDELRKKMEVSQVSVFKDFYE